VEEICLPEHGGIFALNDDADVKLGGNISVKGNAYLYKGAQMSIGGSATFDPSGKAYTDSDSQVIGYAETPMSADELKYRDVILTLSDVVKTMVPTQLVDPMNPDNRDISDSTTYMSDTNPDPAIKVINTISAQNVMLGSGKSIKLKGDQNSVFVLKIAGTANLGDGIILDGVSASNVLIYFSGSNDLGMVSIGGTSKVSGTFLVPERNVDFKGQGQFEGAIISGSMTSPPAISLGGSAGGDATFNAKPFCAKSMNTSTNGR
jgi:hypothetical protein